ncbi:hypothetical protein GDO81_021458 [Engystomops pustulosus]|uniref:Purple acid phosphatase N-terminal domain-containing protein n=1 Tax=Engystomops pustulosus TaxID=76066 RepID=A0AAV6YPK9_ENGPU|nr:hypothetical protein GDO81_021458 [Engystomops pustulosus]
MTVTWSTFNWTPSVVEFNPLPGPPSFNLTAYGSTDLFVDGGPKHRKIFIHRVTLENLKPGQKYVYHCGSSLGWSPQFYFRVLQDGSSWGPRLAVYGDMGNDNAQSLSRLQKETQMEMYDAILHVGKSWDFDVKGTTPLIQPQKSFGLERRSPLWTLVINVIPSPM